MRVFSVPHLLWHGAPVYNTLMSCQGSYLPGSREEEDLEMMDFHDMTNMVTSGGGGGGQEVTIFLGHYYYKLKVGLIHVRE